LRRPGIEDVDARNKSGQGVLESGRARLAPE